jgi:ketosteroid isomerase-like protein
MSSAGESTEQRIRDVIATIDAAWRLKQFTGLDQCFHEDAVIVGPGYTEYARGREKCAESYREFATNAAVLSYSESSHTLRTWETIAVYTFAWEMQYQRQEGPKRETGTDQLVFELMDGHWQLVWRYICFVPSEQPNAA